MTDPDAPIPMRAWPPMLDAILDDDMDRVAAWLDQNVTSRRRVFQAILTLTSAVSTLVHAAEMEPDSGVWGLRVYGGMQDEEAALLQRAGQLITAYLNDDRDMVDALTLDLIERDEPDDAQMVVVMLVRMLQLAADELEAQQQSG